MPMRQATTKASRKEDVEWIGYPAYISPEWAPTLSRTTAEGRSPALWIMTWPTYLKEGHPRDRVASNRRMRCGQVRESAYN